MPAERISTFGTTIFATMSALAVEHGAVNLGQGFPDDDPPPAVLEGALAAIRDGHNQYAPGIGIPSLREAVAGHQRRYGLTFDPDTEVTVTAGATEALAASILAHIDPGDEVLLFEPFYDAYHADVILAGGRPVPVPLGWPDLTFDLDEMRSLVTPRTTAIILNSPHNPTGKVFTRAELASIAELCVTHDLLAITDEPYEHLVFDGEHVPLATMEGMRERTITVSSAAKTYSCTGWKVGWACASPSLTSSLRKAKQWLTYTNGTPFQYAVAMGLTMPNDYLETLREDYRARRDRLCAGLGTAGFTVRRPAGTYFVMVDAADLGHDDGVAFCQGLVRDQGVAAIPAAGFHTEGRGRSLVRFAFCKSDAVLDEGIERLRRLSGPRR